MRSLRDGLSLSQITLSRRLIWLPGSGSSVGRSTHSLPSNLLDLLFFCAPAATLDVLRCHCPILSQQTSKEREQGLVLMCLHRSHPRCLLRTLFLLKVKIFHLSKDRGTIHLLLRSTDSAIYVIPVCLHARDVIS